MTPSENGVICPDCGALVVDTDTHQRFHSVLDSHAWALAVLQTAHIAAHVHDRYEAYDKINSKTFDNWSADALTEVVATLPDGDPPDDENEDGRSQP